MTKAMTMYQAGEKAWLGLWTVIGHPVESLMVTIGLHLSEASTFSIAVSDSEHYTLAVKELVAQLG